MSSNTLPRMRSVRRKEVLTPRLPLPAERGGDTDSGGEGGLATTAAGRGSGRVTGEGGLAATPAARAEAGDAGALAERNAGQEDEGREQTARGSGLPAMLMSVLAMPLANDTTRHWLVEAGATLCVAGGFIAAPFLTVTAWIGLTLPRRVLLHQASTALFLIAILWMAAALIGAHLHHHHQPARAAGGPGEGD